MSDIFYRKFEEKYRGSRELIKTRLRAYISFIKALAADAPGATVLDLGCGRGEWLEIVTEIGLTPFGIDLDEEMLRDCRALGLNTKCGDAIAYLSSVPNDSQIIVSAFHLIEHIPFDQLRTLVSESLRVLMPGGLLIMETPNPENIVVATSSFYLDPTHDRPIPPLLLSFLAEHCGFSRVKTLRLQEAEHVADAKVLTLHDVLAGASQDYAIVAQKMADGTRYRDLDTAFSTDYGVSMATLAARYQTQTDASVQGVETVSHAVVRLAARLDQAEQQCLLIRQELESSQQMVIRSGKESSIAKAAAVTAEAAAVAAKAAASAAECRTATTEKLAEKLTIAAEHMRILAEVAIDDAVRARQMVDSLHASRSWRITAPLRWIGLQVRLLRTHGFAERVHALFIRVMGSGIKPTPSSEFTTGQPGGGKGVPPAGDRAPDPVSSIEIEAESERVSAKLENLNGLARTIHDQLKVAIKHRQESN